MGENLPRHREHRRDSRGRLLGRARRGHDDPTLVAKTGRSGPRLIQDILALVDGPVPLEVTTTQADEMIKQAGSSRTSTRTSWSDPDDDGGPQGDQGPFLSEGVRINTTLIFSGEPGHPRREGGREVRSFRSSVAWTTWARNGMQVIRRSRRSSARYEWTASSSSRACGHPLHVIENARAKLGADIVHASVRRPQDDAARADRCRPEAFLDRLAKKSEVAATVRRGRPVPRGCRWASSACDGRRDRVAFEWFFGASACSVSFFVDLLVYVQVGSIGSRDRVVGLRAASINSTPLRPSIWKSVTSSRSVRSRGDASFVGIRRGGTRR